MNNRTQQRFDRSIAEALKRMQEARERVPRGDLTAGIKAMPAERTKPRGRLYLDPESGATIWDPDARDAGAEHRPARTTG